MAKKRNEKRKRVSLTCTNCKRDNYCVSKNVQNTPTKLDLNKFCKHCRAVFPHKETKLRTA